MRSQILKSLGESHQTLSTMREDQALVQALERVAQICIDSLKQGNKLLFMGNGGSAADAQHLAGEMVSRFCIRPPGPRCLCLDHRHICIDGDRQ